MKKITFSLVALLVSIITLVVTFNVGQTQPTAAVTLAHSAQMPTHDTTPSPSNTTRIKVNHLLPATPVLTHYVNDAQDSLLSADEIATEVEARVMQWRNQVVDSPGWFHMVTHHQRDKQESSVLPNGQTISLNYISEVWFQLDADDLIVAAVSTMFDLEGNISQQSIYQDEIWHNLTLDFKFEAEPLPLRLGSNLLNRVTNAPIRGHNLSREIAQLDQQTVLVFTIQEPFKAPAYLADIAQSVTGSIHQAHFNPVTGDLMRTIQAFTLVTGEMHVMEETNFITLESKMAPPQEVKALLNIEVQK